MKRIDKFKKIMNWVVGAKIFCISASFLYFFFSIWRFFELPLTERLAPLMNILLFFVKLGGRNTLVQVDDEHSFEVGYIVLSVLFFILAIVFHALQKYVPIAETQEELEEIRFKRKQEEDMNKELQNAYIASIEIYKEFSVFVKLKYRFANTAYLDRDRVNLDDMLALGYQEILRKMKADFPAMRIERRGDCIFMLCKTFDRFDLVLGYLLNCIKDEKTKYAKDAIMVDFLIAVDSQKEESEAELSYKTLRAIGNLEYTNKAVVTLTFKQRYELLQFTKFKTDYLCNFQVDNIKSEDRELFTLRSRPTHI